VSSRIRVLWRRLRVAGADIVHGAFGTDAYERYCAHHATHHADTEPMDRAAYFRHQQAQRWHGVSRCC